MFNKTAAKLEEGEFYMEITIREASKEDARSIIELSKVLGAETDHLSFGAEGLSVSVEKEASYINSIANSQKNIFLGIP